jgi:hydrogenase expression/formation protein HypE
VPGQDDYAEKVGRISLSHGAGGRMSRDLISRMILVHFGHPILRRLEDSAVMELEGGRLAFTTDSYVISPLFFPGGDIGKLAIAGTVNDLLCAGARPRYLSLSLIIEEGLAASDLDRILSSASREAKRAGVDVICGDTKVVERGKGDGLFINTTGIGWIPPGVHVSPANIRQGDAILVSGTVGDHGIAILSQREGFRFESHLESDCAALQTLIQGVLETPADVHCLRDPTRGGLGTVLAEIAADRGVGIEVDQALSPVRESVRGACELLGLDVLYVANEGKMVLFVDADRSGAVLAALRRDPSGREAAVIGRVVKQHPGLAVMRTAAGGSRIVDLPTGELLPRIC